MRLIREPLVHFVLAGALLFAGYQMFAEPADVGGPPEVISIAKSDVERLKAGFERTWRREPTSEELRFIIDGYVREEILNREARLLGLDANDEVIRRRLVQKMDYLLSASAEISNPTEVELGAFYRDNMGRYQRPARFAFDQIFLGEKAEAEAVAKILDALKEGESHRALGEHTLLPPSFGPGSAKSADKIFGDGFAEAIGDLEIDRWSGPVRSGYGQHVVRVKRHEKSYLPELNDIRASVIEEWRWQQLEKLKLENYEALADRYQVELPDRG